MQNATFFSKMNDHDLILSQKKHVKTIIVAPRDRKVNFGQNWEIKVHFKGRVTITSS